MILNPWQKKQAALLYFFSSNEYLQALHVKVRTLQTYVDELLKRSQIEGRDLYLRDEQWGDRNTSENWSNHAWAFLADFGISVVKDIADRASNIYHVTGAYQCGRGISEYSMHWTSLGEQEKFDTLFDEISKYAGFIDKTMDTVHRAGRWHDFGLTMAWQKHVTQFNQLPRFRVIENIGCSSGAVPPKTGVYISTDYPDATLQFAWNGDEYGKLRECSIFNELGRRALATIGRSKLWLGQEEMLAFVRQHANCKELIQDSFYMDSLTPELSPSLVARHAFTNAPSNWCYVELVENEFESIDIVEPSYEYRERSVKAGNLCEESGFYFSPASSASQRFFKRGETFPDLESSYGNTIWQWHEEQQ